MTARRNATTYPTPALTGGTDEIRVACADRMDLFDAVIDGYTWAVPVANKVCNGCPIKAACWTANADEPWVQTLRGERPATRSRNAPEVYDNSAAKCGTNRGYDWHRKKLGEPACDACKAAHAKHTRESARRKKAERAAMEAA